MVLSEFIRAPIVVRTICRCAITLVVYAIAVSFAPNECCAQSLVPSDTTGQQRSGIIPLSLGRKIKVSDKYLLSSYVTYKLHLTTEGPGKASTDSTYTDSARIHGIVDVTSVTESGEEYEKTLTIRYFERFVNNSPIDVLPNGSVVKATFGAPAPSFTVNGAKPSAALDELLRLMIRSEGGTATGEILDPHKPVQIGDSWPINKKAFALSMGAPVTKKVLQGIDGQVRFTEVTTINTRPCVTVVATILQESGTGTVQSPAQKSQYDLTVSVPLDERYPAMFSKVRARVHLASRAKGIKSTRDTDITVDARFDR